MKLNLNLVNIFKSPIKGTFVSATLTTFFAALLAVALYVNDNYSDSFRITSKFYSSVRGFTFGVVVPLYVGLVTAGFVFISKKIMNKFKKTLILRNLALTLMALFYLPLTFLGALLLIYFGN